MIDYEKLCVDEVHVWVINPLTLKSLENGVKEQSKVD
jgi:hypothetical protein